MSARVWWGCVVAVLLAGCGAAGHRAGLVGGRRPEARFASLRLSVPPSLPTGSVSRLVAGRWSELPRAPIAPRTGASVIWTGQELLIWGGASGYQGEDLRSNGAAYSPATGRWRLLATAPLSGRQGQAAVWTGQEMVVWGGYHDLAGRASRVTDDGAAYDPVSNTWRMLPPAPLSARTDPIAVWTGREVLVLGGQPAVLSSSLRSYADSAAYDPALNRWTPIAAPVPPRGQGLDWVAGVQAGRELLAWSDWSITHQTGPGSFTERGGVDLFAFNEQTGRWRLLPTEPNELPAVDTALWTGHDVLARGITYNCGSCPGPFVPEATDVFNLARNSWKRLPADPLGSNDPLSAWTGAALVSFIGSGQFGTVGPGSTVAYDPLTNRWRHLPHAPYGCDSSQAPIWTGQALLLYCPRTGKGAAGRHDGLAFTPAASGAYTTRIKRRGSGSAESRVPRLAGLSAVSAYARLHGAGLRVSIPQGLVLEELGNPAGFVERVTPRAGTRLARGSIVTFRFGCPGCGLASPAVPTGTLPRYTVPNFIGQSIAAASRWVAHKTLYFTERLGRLKAGDAPILFENYRITAQHPAPGTRIALGTGTHNAAGTSGTFTPTPLTITADQ
jgi:hypothetical protein